MQVIKYLFLLSKEKEMSKGRFKTFVGCEHCGGETKIETKQATTAFHDLRSGRPRTRFIPKLLLPKFQSNEKK